MPARYVKNVTGTTGLDCFCDSWLDHWINFSGQSTNNCVVIGCLNEPTVGAHVHVQGYGESVQILPMCDSHNSTDDVMEVSDRWNPVSANPDETCGLSDPSE